MPRLARSIAVVGGLGYLPKAPGTAGSLAGASLFLAAVLFAPGLPIESSAVDGVGPAATNAAWALWALAYVLGLGVLLALGIWASGRAEIDFGRSDDGRIVVDEVVGQLIALTPLGLLAARGTRADLLFWGVVTGFVLFRLFDIAKPGLVGWAERRFEGGFGVVADDVVAGIHAAICLLAIQTGLPLLSGAQA